VGWGYSYVGWGYSYVGWGYSYVGWGYSRKREGPPKERRGRQRGPGPGRRKAARPHRANRMHRLHTLSRELTPWAQERGLRRAAGDAPAPAIRANLTAHRSPGGQGPDEGGRPGQAPGQ
jgi:hypothetical protein